MAALRSLCVWCWRWSLVATLPAAAFFLAWLVGFARLFADFRVRFDLAPYEYGFAGEGAEYARHLLNELRVEWSPGLLADDLPVIQLLVPGGELDRLDAQLPQSGLTPVPGKLRVDRGWIDVDVRYRGDFWYHWAYPKKSLRVRPRGKELAFGMSAFNLIAPKLLPQINDVVAYQLAQQLGVLAPRAEVVQVRMNGVPRGIYLLVEQPSETMLRQRGCLSTGMWSGELVAREAWAGVDNRVFDHPDLWGRRAEDDPKAPDLRGPLRDLCALLAAPPSDAVMAAVETLVDADAFGRFFAAQSLTQSLHIDDQHNWRLCYDGVRQRFVPLQWDPNGWGAMSVSDEPVPASLDPVTSRLHDLLLASPRVLAARARALHAFLDGDGRRAFLRDLRRLVAAAAHCVPGDPDLRPPDPAAVLAALNGLPATIVRTFDELAAAAGVPAPVRFAQRDGALRFAVADRVPLASLWFEFEQPQPDLQLVLRVPRRGGAPAVPVGVPVGVPIGVPVAAARTADQRRFTLTLALPAQLVPAPATGPHGEPVSSRAVLPAVYELAAADGAPLPPVRDLGAVRADDLAARGEPVADLPLLPVDQLLLVGADAQPAPTFWAGAVTVDGVRTIAGDLLLAAGSEVQLGPDASLVVRGRLLANGTEQAPVRFVRARADAPWGAIALQGCPGGSVFSHCEFDGGSARATPDARADYPAMVAVHAAGEVLFDHCRFRGQAHGRALVRAACSDVEFAGCRFDGAPGDGLAVDLGAATLRDCTFADVRGSGLALAGSGAVAVRCDFRGCGKRGVAAAERSRALIADSRLAACATGLFAAEDSDLFAVNCSLAGSDLALHAVRGSWRWGAGGRLQAWRCVVEGGKQAANADDRAHLLLVDCSLSPAPAPRANLEIVQRDADAAARDPLVARRLGFSIPGREQLVERVLAATAADRRGAP